ncbi:MAG: tetratricopeptide repeat protein [Deltaproteobacteria bacterium]|nr:tetratricopeptide repeat protein [Deltaproteobacteria bacterium]
MQKNELREANLQALSDFYRSGTEKIYLIIGNDDHAIHDFYEECMARASENNNLILRFEIRHKEHSKHFLYRWLYEMVSGKSFFDVGSWSDITAEDPNLKKKLELLLEKDIRPLEIRFLEGVRFIADKLKQRQKLLLSILPGTDLNDRVFVDFFRSIINVLPVSVKMIIWQAEKDVVAQQEDFSPSNRIILEDGIDEKRITIGKKYETYYRTDEGIEGRIIRAMSHFVYPVDLEFLSDVLDEDKKLLQKAVQSDELSDLIEVDSGNCFRLTYPRTVQSEDTSQYSFDDHDKRAIEYIERRFLSESGTYSDLLYHSYIMSHISDPDFVAEHIMKTCRTKMDMGGADVCELEFEYSLSLMGENNEHQKAALLLKLGELRESKMRNAEAIEVIDKSIEIFRKTGNKQDLQRALELKGQAAFSMREIDTARVSLEESLNIARDMGKDVLSADILSQLGYLFYSMKKLDEAERAYSGSLDIYRNIGKTNEEEGRKGEAAQLANLGHTNYAKGEFIKADEFHRKALEIYESLGDQDAQTKQWGYLGHTYFAKGDFDKAVEAYEKSADIEEKYGDPQKAIQRYASIGHALYAQRKPELAIESFQKALDRYRESGDIEGQAAQLSNLGLVKGDRGEHDRAIEYFEQAAELFKSIGDPLNETSQIVRMGHIRLAQKKYEDAENLYKKALDQYEVVQYPIGKAETHLNLGQFYYERNRWEEATDCFKNASTVYSEMRNSEREASCLVSQGYAEAASGDMDSAINTIDRAIEIYANIHDQSGIANAKSKKGLIYFEKRNFEDAERLYREALEEYQKMEDRGGESSQLANLGTLYYETEQLAKARKEYEKALLILRGMSNPLGLAGVLTSMSYVYEQEKKYGEASSSLKEARKIYENLNMEAEVNMLDTRISFLEKEAEKSLENIRAELFSGLSDKSKSTSRKKQSKKNAKIGRNDPCPCGSGKKYKNCCGA